MFLKIILLGLFFFVHYTAGRCGLCQENNVACHSENTYSFCEEGSPTGFLVGCPKDNVCTNDPAICVRKVNDALIPSCITEKLPVVVGTFNGKQHLINRNSSILTLNSNLTHSSKGEAAVINNDPSSKRPKDGYVVNANVYHNSEIRPTTIKYLYTLTYNKLLSSIKESKNKTESLKPKSSKRRKFTCGCRFISNPTTETTTNAPRDATSFCSENKSIGTFKAEGDTTCKRYYVCTTSKDGFKGYEFNCGERNYFNSETRLCQKQKPDDC